MATGTALQAVADWKTVEEPTDWQTVTEAPAAYQPEARTVGNYLKEAEQGVGRGLRNDVTGVAQTIAHPIDTATNFAKQAGAAIYDANKEFRDTRGATLPQRAAAAALTGLEEAPVIGGMIQHAEQGDERMASPESVGAAAEGITTFAAPELVGKGVGRVIKKLPEVARAASGTGKNVVGGLVKETKAANEASAAKAGEAQAVETKRGGLQKDIHEKSRELQARIETAREGALKEGNEKYSAINEKLSPMPADMENVFTLYQDAAGSIGDVQAEPPIIRRLGKSIEQGDMLTYKDMQALYSELGKELSKGTLPGSTYHAYDLLHEGLGADMQRIADSQGMGQQLTAARDYWRRMKQTFGKPYVARDAASKTLSSLSPEFSRAESTGNRVRLLSHYDPQIERGAGEVTEARKGLKSLPKAKPTTAVKKTISAEDVRAAKAEGVAKRADMIEHRGTWVATWPLFHVMSSLMRGEIPNVAGTAMESLGTYGAVRGVAGILRNPRVVEFLTKATPKDIEQIPPDLRGSFPGIVQAAQKQGIKVAPALLRLVQGGSVVGQTKKRVAAALQPQ